MVHYHPPRLHFRVHPHLSQGARDSLWLFVALAIMIVVATAIQVLFSMV
ncbi:MAG: hypothetical protein WA840_23340 [Caulobacteraceae bacterium]